MKPSIIKAGIRTAITAAAFTTVAGFVPVLAGAVPALPGMPELPQKLAGKTVFLDPGHQGPNHNQNVARPVDDGRGGTKPCQTTGMTTINGIPEHTINWNVAQLVKTSLEGLGAHVVLSRPDDTGWGGCIDERAAAANQSGADVAVSIHSDSAPAELRGFHLIIPQLPVPDAKANEAQSGPGLAASSVMRDAYLKSGFPAATYAGAVEGMMTRNDVAGPALTQVPDVFLEMGNGANPEDAAMLESQEGQLRHAVAITTGVAAFLLGLSPGPAETEKVAVPEQAPLPQAAQPAGVETPGQPAVVDPHAGQPAVVAPQPAQPAAVQPQAAPPAVVEQQPAVAPQPAVPAEQPVPAPQDTQVQQGTPQQPVPNAEPQQSVPQAQQPAPQQGSVQLPAPAPAVAEAPVPVQPNQPQVVPAQHPQPERVPAAQPVSEGIVYPVPAGANSVSAPAAKPQPAAPAAPAAPGASGTKPNSGATPSAPGATSPGVTSPGADKGTTSSDASIKSLVQTAMQLLSPLAKMFGMDSQETGMASSLVNLAYTLVSTLVSELVSPSK